MTEIAPDMKLRISVELRQKIEKAAKANGRTMNGEINVRLEASFNEAEKSGTSVADLEATVAILMGQLDRLQYDVRMLETKVGHLEGRGR